MDMQDGMRSDAVEEGWQRGLLFRLVIGLGFTLISVVFLFLLTYPLDWALDLMDAHWFGGMRVDR